MPKIVPTAMPASTLLLPSRGSNTHTYFPVSESTVPAAVVSKVSIWAFTGISSSSEAMVPSFPVYRSAFFSTSLVMTSSFFWSSPWTFTAPSRPSSSACARGAVFTSFEITLVASRMEFITDRMSVSTTPCLLASIMYRFSVTPVCSQTPLKLSGFRARTEALLLLAPAWRRELPAAAAAAPARPAAAMPVARGVAAPCADGFARAGPGSLLEVTAFPSATKEVS
mmetsp:Transcript_103448/g.246343  ORF Transcript_103448/g.246343 Transcript_103448/m.246343 type:complete len:225 (+) Transcript_103448:937-1611(+)